MGRHTVSFHWQWNQCIKHAWLSLFIVAVLFSQGHDAKVSFFSTVLVWTFKPFLSKWWKVVPSIPCKILSLSLGYSYPLHSIKVKRNMWSHDYSNHTNCCGEIFPVANNLQSIPYPFPLAPICIQKYLSLWSGSIRNHYNRVAYFSSKISKDFDAEDAQEMLPFSAAAKLSN